MITETVKICPHCHKPFQITASAKDRGSLESHLSTVKANETIYKKAQDPKYREEHPNSPMVRKWISEH